MPHCRESKWKVTQKLKKGDYLLCYDTEISRFICIFETALDYNQNKTPKCFVENFSCHLQFRSLIGLDFWCSIQVYYLKDNLSLFLNLNNLNACPTTFYDASSILIGQGCHCFFYFNQPVPTRRVKNSGKTHKI